MPRRVLRPRQVVTSVQTGGEQLLPRAGGLYAPRRAGLPTSSSTTAADGSASAMGRGRHPPRPSASDRNAAGQRVVRQDLLWGRGGREVPAPPHQGAPVLRRQEPPRGPGQSARSRPPGRPPAANNLRPLFLGNEQRHDQPDVQRHHAVGTGPAPNPVPDLPRKFALGASVPFKGGHL